MASSAIENNLHVWNVRFNLYTQCPRPCHAMSFTLQPSNTDLHPDEGFEQTKHVDSADLFRDWSLITGRGGATKREGVPVNFHLYEKGGKQF